MYTTNTLFEFYKFNLFIGALCICIHTNIGLIVYLFIVAEK